MKFKIVTGIMLTFLMVSMVIVLVEKASSLPIIAQTNSTTTVYLDPATINGTAIGQEFNVSIMIRDAIDVYGWQAGLIFNAALLNCTAYMEGPFLKSAGPTFWLTGTINNAEGVIDAHGCCLMGDYKASGDGTLAYLTFKVKAPGLSDLHLRDVMVVDYYSPPGQSKMVPLNIIDVYTVIVGATAHKVVTVSNSTGLSTVLDPGTGNLITVHSGFYDHAFSIPALKISFKVTGPYKGFSNVTIPKTFLSVSTLDEWGVKVDGKLFSTEERIITENNTHTSIYFTYGAGIRYVQITARPLINSVISITFYSRVPLESNVTISGKIDPVRPNVTVTILLFPQWTTLATLTTDPNSHYHYTWTPEMVGTYAFMAMWEGDDNTFGDISDVRTLTVCARVIYIRADGNVDPPTAPISSVGNVTYTFTDYINKSIVVERDNIVVDGASYTVQGTGSEIGIDLTGRSNVTIQHVNIKDFETGIVLSNSGYNKVLGTNIANNDVGIFVQGSSNNTISGNTITNNHVGIRLYRSSNNKFYYNNFIDNTQQVHILTSGYPNFWDNDFEGNYWSNYTGADADHDGIGDTPHVIDADNQDNCPLMGMFHSFNTSSDHQVNVVSNSTIEDFTFFESNSTIKIIVSNMTANQTNGFCRLTIPHNIMSPPYSVTIDDTSVPYTTISENETLSIIYFGYEHSTHKIIVIPEFPSLTILPLFMLLSLISVAFMKLKKKKQ